MLGIIDTLRSLAVEAVAVCLLWSIANPAHELRVGELLRDRLPGVPFTLSHDLNPSLREYRRASSTAIDASLKPIMSEYLAGLESRLRAAGFGGRVLMVTSGGGVLDAAAVAQAPIHAIGSGPRDGARGRPPLRAARRRRRHGGRRRRGRDELRRQPRPAGADPVDAADVARASTTSAT